MFEHRSSLKGRWRPLHNVWPILNVTIMVAIILFVLYFTKLKIDSTNIANTNKYRLCFNILKWAHRRAPRDSCAEPWQHRRTFHLDGGSQTSFWEPPGQVQRRCQPASAWALIWKYTLIITKYTSYFVEYHDNIKTMFGCSEIEERNGWGQKAGSLSMNAGYITNIVWPRS